MTSFSNVFGISELPNSAKSIIKSYLTVESFATFAFNLVYIILVLFFLETLSPEQVGIIWAIYFGVIAVLDYPTGVLGDLVGHKRILLIAYLFHIIAFYWLINAVTFIDYTIFMILFGVASSQESGALQSWLDNNYNEITANEGIDEDRQIFAVFTSKRIVLFTLVSMLGYISGGFIATTASRSVLFILSLLMRIFVFILIILLISHKIFDKTGIGYQNYLKKSYDGLKFLFSSKYIFFFFIGSIIIFSLNLAIWHPLMLFRVYAEYSGSDFGVGLLRGAIFITGVFWQLLIIKYIKRFAESNKWVFISAFFSNVVFFVLLSIYYNVAPAPLDPKVFLIIGLILIYQIPSFLESLEGISRSKIELDIIPNEIRNTVYSLIPSLMQLLGLFLALLAGKIIEDFGMNGGFILVIFLSLIGSMFIGYGISTLKKN